MAFSLKNKENIILLSLGVSILVMALKVWAYLETKSNAVLTDAAESIVNIVAASFGLYSIYLAKQPKDANHLYGHGKIEFFSSGLEGFLIIIAGIGTFIPAIFQLIKPSGGLQNLEIGIGLTLLVIALNGGTGFFVYQSGKKLNSIVLQADGKHLLIDSISSLISLLALFTVKISGLAILDPIIALFLALYIVYNGYKIFRASVSGLMDETDPDLLNTLVELLNKNRKKEWIDIHNLKIMRYGTEIHVDCHLTLPFYMALEEAHDEVGNVGHYISEAYGQKIDFFIHADPCLEQCCNYCQILDCKERKHKFEGTKNWTIDRLITNQKHFENNE